MADVRGVLGGDDDVDDTGRLAVGVFDGDLGLRVGAQPLGEFAGLADARELAAEAVREHDRRGHQLRRLVAGVAKHDALVARALLGVLFPIRLLGIHALRDVGGLSGQVVVDENAVGVEYVVAVHVTDAAHRVADHFLDIDYRADRLLADFRDRDFAADDDDVAFHESLAGHAAFRVNR